MFKKKFRRFSRRSTSSKIPARKIPASIARVRTDWVTRYNVFDQAPNGTSCTWLLAPWNPITLPGNDDPECYSSFGFDVMTAAFLSDLYGDDVKITQMVGHFWLQPVFTSADACFPDDLALLQAQWADYFIVARGGLFKDRVVSSTLQADGAVAHPLNGRDWSDAGWLKGFERVWHAAPPQSTSTTYGEGQFGGVYTTVSRPQYTVPPTSSGSQPTYNVPALTSGAQVFTVGNEGCLDGPSLTRYMGPTWKRVSISSRRTIRMHEDDALTWYIDWSSMAQSSPLCGSGGVPPVPCAMRIIPQLKIKLQYG